MFVLRNVNTSLVTTCCLLKVEKEINYMDFDVGYLQGNTVISMRNKEDRKELWSNLLKGSSTVLWCDGLLIKMASWSLIQRPPQ